MKLFDMHADIGYDVMQKRKQNHTDPLKEHIQKWKTSETEYVGMASYFEGEETWEEMQAMVLALKEEINKHSELTLVQTKADLEQEGTIKALLTIEGMCGIQDHVEEKINWLYEQGVRIASLCWNEENALATGTRGNSNRGLTQLGIQAVKKMNELHMLIDVSHTNKKTFEDIVRYSEDNVIATHSNAYRLCPHVRNLDDEQLKAIKKKHGLVGIVCAPLFVHELEQYQDLEHLIQHIEYIKQQIGIEALALGFDYMDFFETDAYQNAAPIGKKELEHLGNSAQSQNLISALRQVLKEEELACIAYKNALNKVKSVY